MTRVLVKGSYLKWEVEVVAWSYGEDDGNKGGVKGTGDGVKAHQGSYLKGLIRELGRGAMEGDNGPCKLRTTEGLR